MSPRSSAVRNASPLRGEARIRAIERAALEVLAEVGYDQLTIGGVATRAQASKMTIYRQWDDKRDLVLSALLNAETEYPELPADTGTLRGDLIALGHLLNVMTGESEVRRFSSLLHAAQSDEEISLALNTLITERRRADCAVVLERAKARSEIPNTDMQETMFEILTGLSLMRTILQSQHWDEDYIEHVVDEILLPVLLEPGA